MWPCSDFVQIDKQAEHFACNNVSCSSLYSTAEQPSTLEELMLCQTRALYVATGCCKNLVAFL